jgi:multiple sugar transport system ATP-binding protein
MNLCRLPVDNGTVSFAGADVPVPPHAANGEIVVGLRPESLELGSDGLAAEVQVVEAVGADAHVFCVTEVAGTTTRLVARCDVRRRPERGERVMLRALGDEAHLFRADTGERVVA